jgi:DNA repair exonuclease SbcCD ATPase subunit
MWRVDRVEAEDFQSFKIVDVDLTAYDGVTLIVGDRGAGRSNGSGKSGLLEIITWTLHGKTCRKISSVDRVIRRGTDRCLGRVHLTVDGREVVVERIRSKTGSKLRVAGVDGETSLDGLQRSIDSLVGDYDTFTMTSMFSGALSSFCRLPDGARKELLERMLGIERFAAASERAKIVAGSLENELSDIAEKRGVFEGRLARLLEEYQRSVWVSLAYPATVFKKYADLQKVASDAAEAVVNAASELRAWCVKARAERAAARDTQQEWDDKAADLNTAREAVEVELRAATAASAVAASKLREAQSAVSQLKTGDHPDVCPRCGQRWPHKGDPDHLRDALAKHQKAVQDLERELAPTRAREVDLTDRIAVLRREIAAARAEASKASLTLDNRGERRLIARLAELSADLRTHQDNLAEFAASVDFDAEDADMAAIRAELTAVRAKIKTIDGKAAEVRANLAHYNFWKKGFGRGGLPSFLIDDSIPAMNEIVGEIAATLTDGELAVSFDPASAKGSGTVLGVCVDFTNGGDDFSVASRGEQTRVDVSVLFALRDLCARRKGIECGQLFLDEVIDGVDDSFIEAFMSMLRTRYKDRSVFVISHDPAMASLGDRVLKVRKKGAISVVVEPAA